MVYLSSLLLFSLYCFASDVVELEPVQTTYNCEAHNTASATTRASECNSDPYCWWNDSASPSCVDDPCLRIADANAELCNPPAGGTPSCEIYKNAPITYDCAGGSGRFCYAAKGLIPNFDYCFWASLRDGPTSSANCPASICEYTNKRCASPTSSSSQCKYLATKDECGLVPKCLWRSTSCENDPCYVGSDGAACGTHRTGDTWVGGTLANGDCVNYEPYKPDGKIYHYCVNKQYNAKPNLCYFLTPGANTSDTDVDYAPTYSNPPTSTYPTYPDPVCSTSSKITNCDDNPSGACFTKINSKGALAGQYCGDAEHGAANILHIPTLIVFLLVSVFVSMFVL